VPLQTNIIQREVLHLHLHLLRVAIQKDQIFPFLSSNTVQVQLSNQDSKSSFEFKSIAKSSSPSCCNDNAFPEPVSVLDLHPPPDATYSSLSERISASSEGDPSAAPEEASGSPSTPSFDSFLLQRPFEVFA